MVDCPGLGMGLRVRFGREEGFSIDGPTWEMGKARELGSGRGEEGDTERLDDWSLVCFTWFMDGGHDEQAMDNSI